MYMYTCDMIVPSSVNPNVSVEGKDGSVHLKKTNNVKEGVRQSPAYT